MTGIALSSRPPRHAFALDCGASHTATYDRSLLSNYELVPPGSFIHGGINNGFADLLIVGKGQITIADDYGVEFDVSEVLHVPGLQLNVLSISQLQRKASISLGRATGTTLGPCIIQTRTTRFVSTLTDSNYNYFGAILPSASDISLDSAPAGLRCDATAADDNVDAVTYTPPSLSMIAPTTIPVVIATASVDPKCAAPTAADANEDIFSVATAPIGVTSTPPPAPTSAHAAIATAPAQVRMYDNELFEPDDPSLMAATSSLLVRSHASLSISFHTTVSHVPSDKTACEYKLATFELKFFDNDDCSSTSLPISRNRGSHTLMLPHVEDVRAWLRKYGFDDKPITKHPWRREHMRMCKIGIG